MTHEFGGGTLGHPWGKCSWCRGVRLAQRGAIREACQFSPELSAAAEVWQEIKFEYDAVDTV